MGFHNGADDSAIGLEEDPIMRAGSIEFRASVWIIPAIFLIFCGCSKDATAPVDTTPPTAVNDLVAIDPSWNSVTLTWTAPGDDGRTGTAAHYDVRYSLSPLTDAVWPSAGQAEGEPSPRPAGSRDTFVVTGLAPTTPYYFALKTADAEGNWSAKSIIASAPTTAATDTVPPAAVADLVTRTATANTVTLTWTTPGDDGAAGTAAYYDIRYSRDLITDANWTSASQAGGEPSPKPTGSIDTFVVRSLAPGTRHYFALRTADERPNWSALSNVVSMITEISDDVTPPAAVADLMAVDSTGTSITLAWTAPGNDDNAGQASLYDIRYATSPVTSANWNFATQATGEPEPKPAGSAETFVAQGLSLNTRYYFALKTADERPNWSALSNVARCGTGDFIPPAAIADLAVLEKTTVSITLAWTAPGDDGNEGTAAQYDIRYLDSPISDANWAAAQQVSGEPIPGAAGGTETFEIAYLSPNTNYYFSIRAADERPNWSGLSNVVNESTLPCGPCWSAVGRWMGNDSFFKVLTLTNFNDRLIGGGWWDSGQVAAWDGISWSPVGISQPSYISSLAVFAGNLIKGGWSSIIKAWDGASWSTLGSGIYERFDPLGEAMALTEYEGKLIVGGHFTTAGSTSALNVAAWDGNSWSDFGGVRAPYGDYPYTDVGYVYAMTVYDGKLIIGGLFWEAGSIAANKIAAWDGSTWSTLGSGMNGQVRGLAVYDGQLIAGGSFTTAGGVPAAGIAAWNGTSWSALGSGLAAGSDSGSANALSVYNGRLIAAGSFDAAGGASAGNIAAWNGSSWLPLGSGTNDTVSSLFIYNGALVAGGGFTSAGGVAVRGVAAWRE